MLLSEVLNWSVSLCPMKSILNYDLQVGFKSCDKMRNTKKKKRSLILFFFVHSVCQHKCKDKDEKKNYINIRILSSKPCWPPVCYAFDLKKKKMYVISLKSEEQKMVPDFMYIKKKKNKDD